MLPFTRNVFDPMDFTPMVLDRISNIERRTTSAFELALSVLFTSGIQHYAEIPEGMAKAPDYVRDFLKHPERVGRHKVPGRLPGKFVVLARQGEGRWYRRWHQCEATAKTITLDLSELSVRGAGTLIADGDGGNLSFRQETVRPAAEQTLKITLPPQGGFVLVFE
jgi:alpha-glucosidase